MVKSAILGVASFCRFESVRRHKSQCNAVYWSSATLWKAATEIWVKVPCVPGWFNQNAVVMEVQFFPLAQVLSKKSLESFLGSGDFLFVSLFMVKRLMVGITKWFKSSNRDKHFKYAIPVGLFFTILCVLGLASGMEFKDKLIGGGWDWGDWWATMLGGLVGQILQLGAVLLIVFVL